MERNVNTSENERNTNVRRRLFIDENEGEDERENYDNLIMEDNLQQSERVRNEWFFFYVKFKENRLLKLFFSSIKYKLYIDNVIVC